MSSRERRPHTDLPALWVDYKDLTSRCLPARAGRLVRSRRFDRLLLAYALYSLVLGIAALSLVAGTGLLDHLPGWSIPAEPGSAIPAKLP